VTGFNPGGQTEPIKSDDTNVICVPMRNTIYINPTKTRVLGQGPGGAPQAYFASLITPFFLLGVRRRQTSSRKNFPFTISFFTCKSTRRFASGSHHLLVPDPVENAAGQAPLREQKVDEPEHRQQQRHSPVVRNRLVVHPPRAVNQDAPLNQIGTAL
jgi:hypothetical protein